MHIAFLASQQTLPGAAKRRRDAFEHDQTMDALQAAFTAAGDRISVLAWNDVDADWSGFDAALIGTTWDYQDRAAEFLAFIDELDIPIFNPPALVRWNSHKRYLSDLDEKGIAVVPTRWLAAGTTPSWQELCEHFHCERLVVKRQIGANSEGQFIAYRDDPSAPLREPMMAQPFFGSVLREGEYSFIFIDGHLSHALIKRAADGDYRVQSAYGGREEIYHPDDSELKAAARAIAALPETPLYARVDMLRGRSGNMLLIELELIEPFLYPLQGPNLGPMLHKALKQRVG